MASTHRSWLFPTTAGGGGLYYGTHGGTRWLGTELSRLVNRLLSAPDEVIRTNVPQRPEVWGRHVRVVLPSRPAHRCSSQIMYGAGVEVFVCRGQLLIRILIPIPAFYQGFPTHRNDETDPYGFRLDFSQFGFGTEPVIFSRALETGTTAVHVGLMPLSAYRRPQSSEGGRAGRGIARVQSAAPWAPRSRRPGRRLRTPP